MGIEADLENSAPCSPHSGHMCPINKSPLWHNLTTKWNHVNVCHVKTDVGEWKPNSHNKFITIKIILVQLQLIKTSKQQRQLHHVCSILSYHPLLKWIIPDGKLHYWNFLWKINLNPVKQYAGFIHCQISTGLQTTFPLLTQLCSVQFIPSGPNKSSFTGGL